jgi:hypothetical protein
MPGLLIFPFPHGLIAATSLANQPPSARFNQVQPSCRHALDGKQRTLSPERSAPMIGLCTVGSCRTFTEARCAP